MAYHTVFSHDGKYGHLTRYTTDVECMPQVVALAVRLAVHIASLLERAADCASSCIMLTRSEAGLIQYQCLSRFCSGSGFRFWHLVTVFVMPTIASRMFAPHSPGVQIYPAKI